MKATPVVSLFAFAMLSGPTIAVAAPPAQAPHRTIKSKEHLAERSGVALGLYEKWAAGDEPKWRQNGKVVLLVHGATWAGRCTFDTLPNYSLMDDLAEAGYDVWTVDLHGYGASAKSPARDATEAVNAVADLDTAIDYIRALRWVEKVDLVGYQWGGQVAGLFAQAHGNKVNRLAFLGLRYQLHDRPATTTASAGVRTLTAQQAYLMPDDGDIDPTIVKRRSEVCMKYGPTAPSGALKDVSRPSQVEPEKLAAPTLVVQGEREGDSGFADRADFFKTLATKDKWFVVVPGVGKYGLLERNRTKLAGTLLDFLDRP